MTIFLMFWYWYPQLLELQASSLTHNILVTLHFLVAVGLTILINGAVIWVLFFWAFGHGEVVDPVTPVVAAILDSVVELCSIIGRKVAAAVE